MRRPANHRSTPARRRSLPLLLALLSALALALTPGGALARTHRASCPTSIGARAKHSSHACTHTRSHHAHAHRTATAGRGRRTPSRKPVGRRRASTPSAPPASCEDGSTPAFAAGEAVCADGSEPICADGGAARAAPGEPVPVCPPAELGSDGGECSGETCTFDSEGPVGLEETTCEDCEAPGDEEQPTATAG